MQLQRRRSCIEVEFKIGSFVGPVYTEGIPGTEFCDVAGNSSASIPLSKTIINSSSLDVGVIGQNSTEDEPLSVASSSSDERSLSSGLNNLVENCKTRKLFNLNKQLNPQ